jgi:hypothetical protein
MVGEHGAVLFLVIADHVILRVTLTDGTWIKVSHAGLYGCS